jgi:serine/threonine-protein kinase SRPK3
MTQRSCGKSARPGEIDFKGKGLDESLKIKIADLGNGCWLHHHFSTEIQTRQYRSPEVLIGCHYDATADIWSLGCMVFELVTGNLLFQPKKGPTWSKNEDHIAQMLELLGPWPESFARRGAKSSHYFNRKGELKRIPTLQSVSLVRLLVEKYRIRMEEARALAQFLEFVLVPAPEQRPSARACLSHPWLAMVSPPEANLRVSDE